MSCLHLLTSSKWFPLPPITSPPPHILFLFTFCSHRWILPLLYGKAFRSVSLVIQQGAITGIVPDPAGATPLNGPMTTPWSLQGQLSTTGTNKSLIQMINNKTSGCERVTGSRIKREDFSCRTGYNIIFAGNGKVSGNIMKRTLRINHSFSTICLIKSLLLGQSTQRNTNDPPSLAPTIIWVGQRQNQAV